MVAKMDSIKLVLAIVASKRWEVYQMHVKSEFTHGKLEEDIYMQQTEGFIKYSFACMQVKEVSLWPQASPQGLICQDGQFYALALL